MSKTQMGFAQEYIHKSKIFFFVLLWVVSAPLATVFGRECGTSCIARHMAVEFRPLAEALFAG